MTPPAATRPVAGAARAFWLLTRLRLRRLVNVMGGLGARSALSLGRKKKASKAGAIVPGRSGTAKKSQAGPVLGLVVGLAMLLAFGSMAFQIVVNLHGHVDLAAQALSHPGAGDVAAAAEVYRHSHLAPGPFSAPLLQATTGLAVLLIVLAVFNEVGARELAKPEWDMEWLVTLPISLPALLWARLVERTFTGVFAWMAFLPLFTVLAWLSGAAWWLSPLLGLAAALPACALAALGRSLVDIGLRLALSPSRLRNLQALMSVLGMAGLYLALSMASPGGAHYGVRLVTSLPAWAVWTPPGLVVQSLNAAGPGQGLLLMGAAWAQIVALAALGVVWMRHQLRHGVLAGGGRESGRRAAAAAWPRGDGAAWLIRSAVQRRELLLLARDRNFLIQTLLLPVVIIGGQFLMNRGLSGLAELWSGSSASVATAAFGVGSYMLALSAFQTLNTEGGALWMLYTFPRSVGSVLKDKAQLWAVLALLYPLVILVPGALLRHDAGWPYLGHALLVLAGVPIYAAIAVALAVFASNPLAQEQEHGIRIKPRYLYLFTLLSAFYGYGIWAAEWWRSVEIMLLAGLLALALWQKAADQLPYLLDPVAAPPPRATIADGLIAAMAFLMGQFVIAGLWLAVNPAAAGAASWVAFVGSGALTYGLLRLVYWRTGAQRLPRVLGIEARRLATWRTGLAWGTAAAAAGVAYLMVLRYLDLLPPAGPPLRLWLAVLCVAAAPLFEEFIFRGLIFGGLRRAMRLLPAAAASAAVFAIVHPPLSVIPVFFLGLCAAMAYERGRSLVAPMLTHALYNAAVLAYALLAAPV